MYYVFLFLFIFGLLFFQNYHLKYILLPVGAQTNLRRFQLSQTPLVYYGPCLSNTKRSKAPLFNYTVDSSIEPQYRRESFPLSHICSDYTSYLKTLTFNICKPFIVDIIAILDKRKLIITVVLSTMHLSNHLAYEYCDYSLFFRNKEFHNQMKCNQEEGQITLQFTVEIQADSNEEFIQFSILDNVFHYRFENIYACVHTPQQPQSLAICSYISQTNTIAEIVHWIQYHQTQQVDAVLLYKSTPITGLESAVASYVKSGFLRVIDYTWPRSNPFVPEIINNQHAHMNSCYYRFRADYDSLVFMDVDEYLVSSHYPSQLSLAVSHLIGNHPRSTIFHIQTFRFTNRINDLSNREQALQQNTLFRDYMYRIPISHRDEMKMLVTSHFGGTLSVHSCRNCETIELIPKELLTIGHFRKKVQSVETILDASFVTFVVCYIHDI